MVTRFGGDGVTVGESPYAEAQMSEPGATKPRLLVVEDDDGIASSLVRAFGTQGYEVQRVSTGVRARAAVREVVPDLVLLDLGLPDMDGLDVCRALTAEHPAIRVLVLTARVEEIDVVLGLDAGAVDYVTKPFRLAELLARVRAHLRIAPANPSDRDKQLVIDDLVIDAGARRVWLGGRDLDLRAKEFDLLRELASHAGNVVLREDLMSRVWDEHWFGSTKTLDVHVASLRRKLGESGPEHDDGGRITTVRGVGYRFEAGRAG